MTFTTFIILAGTIQGVFLAFVLATARRGNRRANRLLAVVILLFSMNLGHVVLVMTGFYHQYPHFLLLIYPTPFLFAPFLLGYVVLLTRPDFKFKKIYLLHFLPFLLNVIFYSVTFFLKSGEYKIHRFESAQNVITPMDYFWSISHVVYTTPYLIAAVIMIKKHQRRIRDAFSAIERMTLAWLQKFFYGLILVFIVNTVFDVLYFMNGGAYPGNAVLGVMVAVMIYFIGYLGWRQPEVFTGGVVPEAGEKYKKSPLSTEQSEKHKERLLSIMESDKPYLNGSLTLKDLAAKVRLPGYQLSQVINEQFQQNFFDFVNSYRITEARQRLQNPRFAHYAILAIAYDCGFHSKSAFNTAFKKHTGMTPSEFRRQRSG